MKQNIMYMCLSILLAIVLPWSTAITIARMEKNTAIDEQGEIKSTEMTVHDEQVISVMTQTGEIVNIELEAYTMGVVLREMPVNFDIEALKAQAVVARTYTMRRVEQGGKHMGASVCTSPACCQGYLSPENAEADSDAIEKVRMAVADTAGMVLQYDGTLIDATYYACSGGRTEDALAVWGTDIPYLQSVSSPGEEGAEHYTDTVTLTVNDFQSRLDRKLPGRPETWFESVALTEGCGVDKIIICGQEYSGLQLRQLLGLRSTAFVIHAVGDTVTITTRGFGHRVGMSQYGADAMASRGNSYRQILDHYYPGTVLVSLLERH